MKQRLEEYLALCDRYDATEVASGYSYNDAL